MRWTMSHGACGVAARHRQGLCAARAQADRCAGRRRCATTSASSKEAPAEGLLGKRQPALRSGGRKSRIRRSDRQTFIASSLLRSCQARSAHGVPAVPHCRRTTMRGAITDCQRSSSGASPEHWHFVPRAIVARLTRHYTIRAAFRRCCSASRCFRETVFMADSASIFHRRKPQARRQLSAAGRAASEIRQPARAGHRRDRHRQDGDTASDGRGFSNAGVPVFCADIKGDLSGIAMMGEAKDFLVNRAEAGQARSVRIPGIPGDLLGPVRRAGPSDPRHRFGNGAAASVAADEPHRGAGRHHQHRLPHRRRGRTAAPRHEGPAGAARQHRRAGRRDFERATAMSPSRRSERSSVRC